MNAKSIALTLLSAACFALPAHAEDSVQRASAASVGASVIAGSAIGWVAYEGSELTVKALQASGDGVVVVLQGASGAIETSAKLGSEAVRASGLAVGQSVQVVAESTGTSLIASGQLIAFVPNELGRALLHHARYQ